MIGAGSLRSLITVQQRTTAVDALGQPVETWAALASLRAEIRHPSGVEQIKADAETSTVRASIRVRRRAGITAGMQAVHGAMVYDIEAVLPDEVDRVYMFLACKLTS